MWGSSSILCFGDLFARGSTQLTLCHVAAIAAPLAAIFFHRLSLFAETYHASWKSFCFDRFFFQLWCLRTVLCTPFQALERLIISLSTRGGGCISHYGSRSCHSPYQVQQCIYAHSTTHLGAHSRKNSSEPMYHHHHGMVHGAMESDVCLLNTPSDTQWNAFQTPCALKAESEIEHHNQSAMRTAKLHRIQDPLSSVCCVEGTQVGTILAPSCELNRSRAVTQMYISRSPVSNSAPWIRRKILCIDFDRTITFLHTSGVQTSQFCTPERILRNINDLNMFTHFTLACLRQGHEVCITSFAGKETLGNKSKKNKSSSRFRPNRGSLEHGVKHLEPYSANPCDSESPHHDAQGRQNDSSSTEEFKNENISFRTRKHRAPEWEREPKPALSEQMLCEPLYGEQLVLRYLDIIFGPHRDFLLPRHVECWHPRNVAELGKNGHIANLLHRSAFREEIALCDIILLDDDFHNVKRARDRGYCAFHCPEGITADWLQKTPHLTDILSLGK